MVDYEWEVKFCGHSSGLFCVHCPPQRIRKCIHITSVLASIWILFQMKSCIKYHHTYALLQDHFQAMNILPRVQRNMACMLALLSGTAICTYHCESIFVEKLCYECHVRLTEEEPVPDKIYWTKRQLNKTSSKVAGTYSLLKAPRTLQKLK